jgi:hypothetical protein
MTDQSGFVRDFDAAQPQRSRRSQAVRVVTDADAKPHAHSPRQRCAAADDDRNAALQTGA